MLQNGISNYLNGGSLYQWGKSTCVSIYNHLQSVPVPSNRHKMSVECRGW